MKQIVLALLGALLLSSCGGSDTSSALRSTDVLQFRMILDEDPLAIKAQLPDGTAIVIGDVLLTDRGIHRTSVDENPDGGFDVELTLSDRERARLEEFWQGRRSTRQLVIVKDGQPWRVIDGKAMRKENRILLESVAPTEDEATALADRIVLWKQKDKPKDREE